MTSPLRKCVYVFSDEGPVQPCRSFLLQGFRVSIFGFSCLSHCLEAIGDRSCSLLVVNLEGHSAAGLELLTQSARLYPLIFSVAVVDQNDVEAAVRAMKAGAGECIESPANGAWWLGAIEKAFARWQTQRVHSNGCLTETERFVLSQVVAGKTSKEIAEMLHRSPRTVEVHRMHIIRKLGVSGTAELVRRAVTTGLIDGPGHLGSKTQLRNVEPALQPSAEHSQTES